MQCVHPLTIKSYAPRTWRCFCNPGCSCRGSGVCSTHVEMFPCFSKTPKILQSMLHARGDVSYVNNPRKRKSRYDPRTWRCFFLIMICIIKNIVCSTHVEMFPKAELLGLVERGMLHARGDVSLRDVLFYAEKLYAPRTWRCFFRL